jgi:hypothetical protein
MTSLNEVYGCSGDHLKAADLRGSQVTVTIAAFEIVEFDDATKVVLSFAGKDKTFVVNKTNAMTIGELHGQEFEMWIGKAIRLYPTKTNFGGKMVDCIRVSQELPATTPVIPEPKPAQSPITKLDEVPF